MQGISGKNRLKLGMGRKKTVVRAQKGCVLARREKVLQFPSNAAPQGNSAAKGLLRREWRRSQNPIETAGHGCPLR